MAFYPNYYNRGNYINPLQMGAMQQPYDFGNMSQPNYQPSQNTNEMLWVLNESEAVAFPVAPNCSAVLWDKNNPTIYVKSVNMQGVPSMRILDFTERTDSLPKENATQNNAILQNFVKMSDFEMLKNDFEVLKARLEVTEKKPTKNKKAEGDIDG